MGGLGACFSAFFVVTTPPLQHSWPQLGGVKEEDTVQHTTHTARLLLATGRVGCTVAAIRPLVCTPVVALLAGHGDPGRLCRCAWS